MLENSKYKSGGRYKKEEGRERWERDRTSSGTNGFDPRFPGRGVVSYRVSLSFRQKGGVQNRQVFPFSVGI